MIREYVPEKDRKIIHDMLKLEGVKKIGIDRPNRYTYILENKKEELVGFFTLVRRSPPILIHFVLNRKRRIGLHRNTYRLLESLCVFLNSLGINTLIIAMTTSRICTCKIIEKYAKAKVFFKSCTFRDFGDKRFYLMEI